jgi:hypothetical protein
MADPEALFADLAPRRERLLGYPASVLVQIAETPAQSPDEGRGSLARELLAAAGWRSGNRAGLALP